MGDTTITAEERAALREQHTPLAVPACRVCGGAMKLGMGDASGEFWHCGERGITDPHFWGSGVKRQRADPRILRLLDALDVAERERDAARAEAAALRAALNSARAVLWGTWNGNTIALQRYKDVSDGIDAALAAAAAPEGER